MQIIVLYLQFFDTQNYILLKTSPSGFILKIFYKLPKFQPQYSYNVYCHRKESVARVGLKKPCDSSL